MWKRFRWSLFQALIRGHLGLVAVAILGTVSLIVGGVGIWRSFTYTPSYILYPSTNSTELKTDQEASTRTVFTVDISGAVVHPGIYELSNGSRVQDVVLMAGGFQAKSDQAYIHRSLNLAKKLVDQEKIYIPFQDDQALSSSASQVSTAYSLNGASKSDVLEWIGVGEKRAEQILAERPYKDVEDFLKRSGVASNFIEVMREKGIEMTM